MLVLPGSNISKQLRELQLERQMIDAGITGYVKQYKFHPKRKFLADFAFPQIMLIVEVEGGVYTGGRHVTGSGYTKDCEKYNEASILGYTIIRVTGEMVDSRELTALHFIQRAIESLSSKR